MIFPVLLEEDLFEFPSLSGLDDDGLVAISRDVTPMAVVTAYTQGIFPWYGELDPVLWWSPNPRCIIEPEHIQISKSMRSVMRNKGFTFSINRAFEQVIEACSQPRNDDPKTWLLPEMIETYTELHKSGLAHSIEVFLNEELVGGFYGFAIGKYFAGESMFSKVSNASKAALITFSGFCITNQIPFIDCQIANPHLLSLGAKNIERTNFLERLKISIELPTDKNLWQPKELTYFEDN